MWRELESDDQYPRVPTTRSIQRYFLLKKYFIHRRSPISMKRPAMKTIHLAGPPTKSATKRRLKDLFLFFF